MLFEKVEKGGIITFYFKTSTVDVGECIQAPAAEQHWPKQHSTVVTLQERLLSTIHFVATRCLVICIICQ